MKRINLLAVLSMVLFSCVCIMTTSCSSYDDIEEIMEQNNPPQNPDNGDDNGNDENNEPEGDWGTIIEKTYGYLGEDQWPSTIKLQKSDGREVVFKVNLPFTLTEWTDEYLTTEDETPSEFVEVCEADTVCTAWQKDENNNYLRKVTRTQKIIFSKFTRTITSESWEAYRYINGKEEYFKTGNTTLSFNPYSGHQREVSEVTEDGIKYEREANLVNATVKFHTESYKLSAYTYIDREIGDDKGDDNGGNNNEPETMPDATLSVAKIVKVTAITSSPEYNATNDKIVKWHNVSLVETEDKFHVYVDGSFVQEWNKADLATSDKYNSAMLDNGKWVPAIITPDSKGWSYVCEYSNGSYKSRTVDMNLALSSGIKNFTENNTAEVSAFVKTLIDTKEYDGKKYISVSGYDVSGKLYLAYTVAEK